MLEAASPLTAIGPLPDAPSETQQPDLGTTYGAMLIGTYIGLMLYGILVYQAYRYWRLYPNDPSWIRALALTPTTVSAVLHTSNPRIAYVATPHFVFNFQGYSLFLCQSFYAVRVYRIERRYVYRSLVGAATVSMFCSFGFTTAATIAGSHGSLDAFEGVSWLVGAMFGFAVLADVSLAGTLVMVLIRSRTGFKSTDSVLEILVIYAINTGLLTSIVGLPCFVFSIILPGNIIYIGIAIVGVKLYANSVLAVLNSRRSLSDRLHEDFDKVYMASLQLGYTIRRPHSPLIFALKETQVPEPMETGAAATGFQDEGESVIDARKLQEPTPVSLTVSTEMVFAPGTVQTQDGSTGSETTAASQAEHDKRRASTRSLV
ncbi:hypothetical protein VTO73DRAFT_7626 [Trametes versicolor]